MEPRVSYRLGMPEPHTHLFEVELRLSDVTGPAELVLPSWTPGSYLLREFARHVQDFSARSAGEPVAWSKADKSSWRVEARAGAPLVVSYRVYANELTVRTSHLDATHGYVNGASLFLWVRGREDAEHEVEIVAPAGWRTTTALARVSENRYLARSYDELVDSPMEIGTHALLEWEQSGLPHQFAVWGARSFDADRLLADTSAIVAAAERMFGGLPYERYLFLLHLMPEGRGGLEHRDSSSLQAERWALPAPGGEPDEKYEDFLALVAHEFFHVWNAKRIRPEALGPFDYTRENYTRDLWVVEGLTTYYTDLLLLRAGRITEARYLERLGEQIARFEALPGRRHQTLAESSFDTWIRFYRPDEHTPNAQISYYQKGALVGLLLDLEIRRASGGGRSLDDLMRLLWERYGSRDVGYPEAGPGSVEALAAEVAGDDLSAFFDRYVRGTAGLDYDRALGAAGLRLARGSDADSPDNRGSDEPAASPAAAKRHRPSDAAEIEARLGIRVRERGGRVEIAMVLEGGIGWGAGLNTGDEIVALDGVRVGSVARLAAGVRRAGAEATPATVELALFRRDELTPVRVELGAAPAGKLRVERAPGANAAEVGVRMGWLGEGTLP